MEKTLRQANMELGRFGFINSERTKAEVFFRGLSRSRGHFEGYWLWSL